MSLVRELNHVAIRVANMDESLRLYRDLLGGAIIRNAKVGKGHFVYVQLAEGVIELIQGEPGAANLGLQHIAFLTAIDSDINKAAEAARSHGCQITVEPKLTAAGDGYLSFFKDKGGTTYEFIQRNDENIRIKGLKNERILEFDHISIKTDNESHADTESLLQNVFGMQVRRILEKPGSVMTYYKLGTSPEGDAAKGQQAARPMSGANDESPDTIELLYTTVGRGDPDTPPATVQPGCMASSEAKRGDQPIAHIAFRVPCASQMYKYLTENGINATEPIESGLGGFYITNATGPDGETIEFLDRCRLEDY